MQQPDILGFGRLATASRSRVPPGFVGFRADLGKFLGRRRKERFGKQQTLADAIGIARPSLSAIERGHAWPLPDTVEGLMRELELNWDMILVRGETLRTDLSANSTLWGDRRFDLGRDLREGRQLEDLTLRDVSKSSGISVAQLSRIERGQAPHSRVFEDEEADRAVPREFRRVRFRDPGLHRLATLVG